MNELLVALIGIAVLANLAYTIWSHFSLKKLCTGLETAKPEDKFILENIVHTRSSLNLLYASIAIMVFVLGYFGFNIQKNVREGVTKDITAAARVDLDTLRMKADSVSLIDPDARLQVTEISQIRRQIETVYESVRKFPQRLFVIHAIPISKQKYKYSYSELRQADGNRLPKFLRPPILMWRGYNASSEFAVGITATTEGIEVSTYDEPFVVDLWVYAF